MYNKDFIKKLNSDSKSENLPYITKFVCKILSEIYNGDYTSVEYNDYNELLSVSTS